MSPAREKLRNWVYLRLQKIYFWLQTVEFRAALKLKNISTLVLDLEIRTLDSSFLQRGDVDSDDALVEYVSRVLTNGQIVESVADAAHTRSELAATLLEKARINENIREVLRIFFLADAFIASILRDDTKRDDCLNRASEISSNIKLLDSRGIYDAYARVKKRYGVLRKELAERSAIKIEVGLSSIVSLIGIVSAILVVAGYLYTTILLDAFSVDASVFFSLPDYLAASLEQLRNAGYSAAIGLIFFVYAVRETSLRSRLERSALQKQHNSEDWAIFVAIVSCVIAVVLGAYKNQPEFNALEILGALIAYWLAAKIAIMFFKKPLSAIIFLTVTLVFSVHVGVRLYHRIYDLKSGHWKGSDATKVSLKVPLSVADESLVVITANSNFVFALSKEDRSVYVIPRDNVKLFKISNEL